MQQQGTTFAYGFFPMLGTNLYALAAVLLAFFTARRVASTLVSMLAALALFFGTPCGTTAPWSHSTPTSAALLR
jgi:ABC-type Na+ efflux pump permease subunit